MKSILLIVLLCLLPGDGGASDTLVYKCQEGGQYAYQSMPCPGKELKRWAVRPEVGGGEAVQRIDAIRAELKRGKQKSSAASRSAGRQRNSGRKADACAQARAGRERAYAKAGVKRDFAMSSFWDNKVHQACW